ncbi:MAG TPA: Glu/Leu/Phe/Val dehydrogenase [Flavobacteriales bacterium]|nr:Glu/Leu/Phe/Val dehydrogenase [Flavobacteriales bacterium]
MMNVEENVSELVVGKMETMGHEQVVFCTDKVTGLKAIIAIHDTTLGPALGGTRMWDYSSEAEALQDVLRLSRGMTFKASISGLNLGGGKAVIIGDASKDKTEALMKKFGEYVDSLGGKYITAEDVGMNTKDMEYVREKTKYVTGIPVSMGGSGDPSPVTAYGVYMGMKASAKFKWGSDSLEGKIILVQGVGHVGENLVKHTTKEGAKVYISDIDQLKLDEVSEKYGVEIIMGDGIYDMEMDIYAPCALGSTLNTNTINRLKCQIIAGAANNQLADEVVHGKMIKDKGMVYAPDFLINAGGLINVYSEINGYQREESLLQTKKIYDTTLEILLKAEDEDITTHKAALLIAEQRIQDNK